MSARKGILIASVVLAVGAIGGGTYWFLQGAKEREVKKVADTYVQALEKGSYDKLVDSLSPTSIKSSGYTKEEVINKYQLIFSSLHTENAKVSDVKVEKNKTSTCYRIMCHLIHF
ncbi:hypothetical protein OMQ_00743 [Enterococcus saccharolyticus subsp. saccharolyticus ATCC 43076]|uniref:NTF2-like N-terminal transpeptidase domain-containing protein n=1 Tax=Enterococcus saccharolyticus subsp. saccharolyticus ATCC 43076 TaxID=1139996 RepID=S0NGL5_9ENTE|nr:NTF2-like N-terminal transpeptidase domain-containing protein [Enterococcus saccharolyticus]EOT30051.1 hypothetical protein OMQ_00743 [Enterococcus saccharolyticus subsp. saccharolyticus ATCC 43076]EOT80597.1 hypothetical protein I572_01124 [Enterococcus saccharolyticus subsp. saccharolyticus ATCC 43076]OJG90136.1 hypothetical protein RV16_GL001946 [Enterococcus saccharolyticus]